MKRSCQILIASALFFILMAGCKAGSVSETGDGDLQNGLMNDAYSKGIFYDFGRDSISSRPKDFAYLQGEYTKWKNNFVVAATPGLRVQRGTSNSNDTVSEGIGYGMLLAYFFNDQATFDGLWTYAKAHTVSSSSLLMHWRVHPDGTDISEFSEPIPHDEIYVLKSDLLDDLTGGIIPGDPDPGINYLNSTNYEGTLDNSYYYTKAERDASSHPASDFCRIVQWDRNTSSAADADFDMAAALCFAAKKWTPAGIDYTQDAADMISAILTSDITSGNFIKNGNRWGGPDCWNPCYFCPAWFRVYILFIDENQSLFTDPAGSMTKLQDTIDNVYDDMEMIDDANANGLYPDWCDTSGASVVKADGSDRWYYFTATDVNNDTYVTMQSFNFFYDAIRVPWRLAVDYSWFGDQCPDTEDMLREMAVGFPNVSAIVDGYSIDGSSWEYNDRDGFNPYVGGTNPSTAFNSMMACSKMILDSPSEGFYQSVVDGWDDPSSVPTAYYPNTLRLLALLYLSGYYDNPFAEPKIVRFQNVWTGRVLTLSDETEYGDRLLKCQPYTAGWNTQQWAVEKVGDGTVRFRNLNDNEYLTIRSDQDNASVITQPLDPTWGSQKWYLEELSIDVVRLRTQWVYSKALNVSEQSDYADIVSYNVDYSWDSQKWIIIKE